MQQKAGQYITAKESQENPGERRTAHEVERDYQQQQQQKVAWISRFFGQFGDEVTIFAGLICNPETQKKEFKDFQKDLEENDEITPELLKKLADQPQGQLIEDMTQKRTQTMVQAAPMIKASPFWDQYGFEKELATRMLGKEIVDKYMNKQGIDPNNELKQMRMQIEENDTIRNGGSIPVADDDHHPTHLKWLVTDLDRSEPGIDAKVKSGQILDEPQVLDNHMAAVKHGDAHVQKWEQQATANKNQTEIQGAEKFKKRLEQSSAKADLWLKQAKQAKDAKEAQAKEAASQPVLPQMMGQGQPQGGGQPMSPDLLKSWINHYDIMRQIEELSGLTPHQENGAKPVPSGSAASSQPPSSNRLENTLTPQAGDVTQ
jgi:hypothetical protein